MLRIVRNFDLRSERKPCITFFHTYYEVQCMKGETGVGPKKRVLYAIITTKILKYFENMREYF